MSVIALLIWGPQFLEKDKKSQQVKSWLAADDLNQLQIALQRRQIDSYLVYLIERQGLRSASQIKCGHGPYDNWAALSDVSHDAGLHLIELDISEHPDLGAVVAHGVYNQYQQFPRLQDALPLFDNHHQFLKFDIKDISVLPELMSVLHEHRARGGRNPYIFNAKVLPEEGEFMSVIEENFPYSTVSLDWLDNQNPYDQQKANYVLSQIGSYNNPVILPVNIDLLVESLPFLLSIMERAPIILSVWGYRNPSFNKMKRIMRELGEKRVRVIFDLPWNS